MLRFAPSRRAGYAASIGGAVAAPSTPAWANTYSLAFDGTNDHLVVANHDDFSFGDGSTTDTPFSVSAWINRPSTGTFRILWKGSATVREWGFTVQSNDTIGMLMYDGGTGAPYIYTRTVGAAPVVPTGQWVHLAATYDGSEDGPGMEIYMDGALLASEHPDSGVYSAMHNTTSPLTIGGWRTLESGNETYAPGKIDDVAIWSVELDADAITAIYNSGAPTDLTTNAGNYDNSSSLIGYWRMEENTGTTVADSSTNSHTATLTNGPTFSTDVPS